MKLFILQNLGVYFCSAMGVASIYWPTSPECIYCRDYSFYEKQKIIKDCFLPKNWNYFLSFLNRTHARNWSISLKNIEVWPLMQNFSQRCRSRTLNMHEENIFWWKLANSWHKMCHIVPFISITISWSLD